MYADFFIETIQSAKKTFVNTFVTDEKLRTSLYEFVDSQTEFAKQCVKTTQTMGSEMFSKFGAKFPVL